MNTFKNMVYKAFAFVTLIVLFGGTGSYLAVFQIEQAFIRQQMSEQVEKSRPKEQLHKVSFSSSEHINWKRVHKEFSYRNEMYDVVYVEHVNDVTHYYCIKDHKETNLIARLNKWLKYHGKKTRSEKGRGQVLKIIFALNCYLPGQIEPVINCIGNGIKYACSYLQNCISFIENIDSPPPRIV